MTVPSGSQSPSRIFPEYLVKIGVIAAWVICLFASFWSFRSYHSSLPTGCDPFGYLYQTKALNEGRLFGQHTERPFLAPLVGELSAKYATEADYAWMIAPHAYHYDSATGQIVNQYPPGTALVLAAFPMQIRSLAYPVAVTTSLLMLTLLAWRERGWKLIAYVSAVVFITSASMVLHPFVEQYRHVGSVAMTFALLIASGWLIRTRPASALALASATVLFRISNVWLLPLVALPLVFSEYFAGKELPCFKVMFARAGKALGIVLTTGIAWILLYQWMLLGSPLRSTYSPLDRELASVADMMANAEFYFNPLLRNWFIVHLIALAGIALMFRSGKRHWLYWALAVCVWNYAFFMTHKVATPYYSCASALILVGLCVSGIDGLKQRTLKVVALAFVVMSAAALASAYAGAKTPESSAAAEIREYTRAFDKAQIVWAENASGTFEYATDKPAFRFNWGTNDARTTTILWLARHGYRQAFMLDDEGMDADQVVTLLRMTGLTYDVSNDRSFRRLAWIDPQPAGQ